MYFSSCGKRIGIGDQFVEERIFSGVILFRFIIDLLQVGEELIVISGN